ncbi:MAG: CshA/CshB family fibrillar adhesin-related protein, partial [Bifidobacteriaceae bacterium]|nr:CshA/CshB family fibrillar adhesin-related protein [Bifidobacteriaceae bacterium]
MRSFPDTARDNASIEDLPDPGPWRHRRHSLRERMRWGVAAGLVAGLAFSYAGLNSLAVPEADARYANQGSGRFPQLIDWFEWGNHGQVLARNLTKTNTREVAGRNLVTKCTVANATGDMIAYRPGAWGGDGLDNLYASSGTDGPLVSGLANSTEGAKVSFTFSCSAEYGGSPAAIGGLVVADAEASNLNPPPSRYNSEYIEAKPDGADVTWRILDTLTTCDTHTLATRSKDNTLRLSPNGQECYPSGTSPAGPTAVAFMEGATKADITVQGAGRSAIALGVVTAMDMGDAPAVYGQAGALFQPRWTDGEVLEGTTDIMDNFTKASPGSPNTRLGESADGDADYVYSSKADADDSTGEDDEDVRFPPLVGGFVGDQIVIDGISCTAPGFVSGWIDWNGTGGFESQEASGAPGRPFASAPVLCDAKAGDSTTVALAWNVPADAVEALVPDTRYVRLRIAAEQAEAARATGFTFNGEVEDHSVQIALPALRLDHTTTGSEDSRPGDTVGYQLTVSNFGQGGPPPGGTVTAIADLTAVLDDATYNDDACDGFTGTACAFDPTTKRIAWTFTPPDVGRELALEYSLTVKPVAPAPDGDGFATSLAWLEKAAPIKEPTACEIDANKVWNDDGVACRAVEFDLPRLSLEKTSDAGANPRVGQKVDYTIRATNTGPGDFLPSAPATVKDVLDDAEDDGAYGDDATITPLGRGDIDYTDSTLTWTGPLASGETVEIEYSATIGPDGDAEIANVAWVPTDPTAPTHPLCQTTVSGKDAITGEVCARTDAALAKATVASSLSGPSDPVEGDEFTYTLTVAGTGTTGFTDAVPAVVLGDLTDLLDNATVIGPVTASLGTATVTSSTGLLSWSYPLAKGQSATVSFPVRVGDSGDASLTALAWITAAATATAAPNCDTAWQASGQCSIATVARGVETPSLTVDTAVDLSGLHNPIKVGDIIDYTYTVANNGNVAIDDVELVDAASGLDAIAFDAWPILTRPGHLTPGSSVTATASHSVTAADLAAKEAVTAVQAEGLDPKSAPVTSAVDQTTTPLAAFAGIGSATFEVLTTSPKVADGVDEHQVQIDLADANSRPVTGVAGELALAFAPSSTDLLVAVSATSTPGRYTAGVTSTKAGLFQVSGAWTGHGDLADAGTTDEIEFTAGAAASATLTSDTSGQVRAPGGAESHRATVTVLDAYANPVPGVAATFSVEPGTIEVVDPTRPLATPEAALTSITDDAGQFTVELTSPTIATATVKATSGGVAVLTPDGTAEASLSLAFDYTGAPCSDPAASYYTLTPTGTQPVATGVFVLRVHLSTCDGKAMVDQRAFLSATATGRDGGGNGAVGDFSPDTPGDYVAFVTSNAAGTKDISATWTRPAGAAGQPIAPEGVDWVEFTPGDPSLGAGASVFKVSAFDAQRVRTGRQQVYVHLEDDYGNTVASPAVAARLTGSSSGNLADIAGFALDPNAPAGFEYSAQVTSDIAGSHSIAVAYRATPIGPAQALDVAEGGLANRDALFVAGLPACAVIGVDPTATQIAGSGAFAVRVQVSDGGWDPTQSTCLGNLVPGVDVSLSAPEIDGPGAASLDPAGSAVTGSSGQAVFTATSLQAGQFALVASFTGPQGSKEAENSPVIAFEAGSLDASKSILSVDDDDPRLADGEASHAVSVALVDAGANPVSGRTVRFALSAPAFADGGDPGEAALAVTGPDGRATVYVRSETPVDASSVYAFVRSASGPDEVQLVQPGSGLPQTVALRFVPADVDPANSGFEVATRGVDPLPTAGVGKHRVVAILADAKGSPAAVDATLLGGTVKETGQPDGVLSDWSEDPSDPTGATYWATATSTSAGTKTVTVTYAGATILPLPSSGGLAADQAPFVAGAFSGANSWFDVASTPNVVADGKACQTVTAFLADAYANPVALPPTRLDGEATPAKVGDFAATPTPGSYEACVTSTVAGAHGVQIALDTVDAGPVNLALAKDGTGEAVFVAGAADPVRSTLTLDRETQTVGAPVVATVTVRDANGNLVGGQAVKLRLDPDVT